MYQQKQTTMNFESINTELELDYIYQDDMTFLEFEDAVEQYVSEQEVIYYSVAIDYLKDNDPSLNEAMELANEMGLSPIQINSELLATLLMQNNLREDWYSIRDEVEELFNEVEQD